jgi:hypothetical protein
VLTAKLVEFDTEAAENYHTANTCKQRCLIRALAGAVQWLHGKVIGLQSHQNTQRAISHGCPHSVGHRIFPSLPISMENASNSI